MNYDRLLAAAAAAGRAVRKTLLDDERRIWRKWGCTCEPFHDGFATGPLGDRTYYERSGRVPDPNCPVRHDGTK